MKLLVFADVHANLAAFKTVLKSSENIDGYLFLGDVVGFGPQPRECVQLLKQLDPLTMVLGNHDIHALESSKSWHGGIISSDAEWESWTAAQLDHAERSFLSRQPTAFAKVFQGSLAYVCHDLPRTSAYNGTIDGSPTKSWISSVPASVVMFAHSHNFVDQLVAGKRLVNPGSVGQPRDGCPYAAFAIWDEKGIVFRRVPYDVEQTVTALNYCPFSPEYKCIWTHNYRQGTVLS